MSPDDLTCGVYRAGDDGADNVYVQPKKLKAEYFDFPS